MNPESVHSASVFPHFILLQPYLQKKKFFHVNILRCRVLWWKKKKKFGNQAVKTEYGKLKQGEFILAAPDINEFFYHLLHDQKKKWRVTFLTKSEDTPTHAKVFLVMHSKISIIDNINALSILLICLYTSFTAQSSPMNRLNGQW